MFGFFKSPIVLNYCPDHSGCFLVVDPVFVDSSVGRPFSVAFRDLGFCQTYQKAHVWVLDVP